MKIEAELRAAIRLLDAEADDVSIHPQDRHRASLFADALLWALGDDESGDVADLLERLAEG